MTGFLKLKRSFLDNMFWKKKREFSEFEALLDIVSNAQYVDRTVEHVIGMRVITTKRGQTIKSLETWAKRWMWNKSKVRRFISLLEKQRIVKKENVKKTIRLTVVGCDFFDTDPAQTRTEWALNKNRRETDTDSDAKPTRTPTQTVPINTNSYDLERHENDTRMTRIRHENDTHSTPEEERKKERRKEGKKKHTPQTPQGAVDCENQNPVLQDCLTNESPKPKKSTLKVLDGFDRFWQAWPKKVDKAQALKVWNRINPDESLLADILQSVEQHKKTQQWQTRQYIPGPAKWLRGARWEDEIDTSFANNRPSNSQKRFPGQKAQPGWSEGYLSPAGEALAETMAKIDKELNPEKYESEETNNAKLRFPEIL